MTTDALAPTVPTTSALTATATERLADALEYVTAHPDRWDQTYWLQRTADGWLACLAGTLVLNAGFRPYVPHCYRDSRLQSFVTLTDDQREALLADGYFEPRSPVHVNRADQVQYAHVDDVALWLLERSAATRFELFDASNVLTRLWYLAGGLTDGAVRPTLAQRVTIRRVDVERYRRQLADLATGGEPL